MNPPSAAPGLHHLAHLYGIETSYCDMQNRRQAASEEIILAVLKEMGAPLAGPADVASAWRECRQQILRRPVSPVLLAWDGILPSVKLRLPSDIGESVITGSIVTDEAEARTWRWRGGDMETFAMTENEGVRYIYRKLPFPAKLPSGYHRLTVEFGGEKAEAMVISAPTRAYSADPGGRTWGAFLPLYSLHTRQSWGAGDFTDLASLAEFIAAKGGRAIGTLPLLATFLDEPVQPSPYLPVSRLFWNEFYLDINRIPELRECPAAQAVLASCPDEIADMQKLSLVDYRRQMELKRRILLELSRYFFAGKPRRSAEFDAFVKARPEVEQYARFRAVLASQHVPWHAWPSRLKNGLLEENDGDVDVLRYHRYVQWLSHGQLQNVASVAQAKGACLYLDLPLGVHPDGYDIWRESSVFAAGFSVGAPPDNFFSAGQNWGFPPVHPVAIRQQRYQYIINYLRHNFQPAGLIRIDHVMGLHRLFWIARGSAVSQGVYVRNRADELYAILSLESHRHKVGIVGEDLGTVSPQVRPAMSRHGLSRMYVLNFELTADPDSAINPVPPGTVASLNTHDIPPFAAFWQGLDINKYLELGFLDEAGAGSARISRQATKKALVAFLKRHGWLGQSGSVDAASVLKACLAYLGGSDASMVLVNLEDLWLEEQPQNIPGTSDEYHNWQRKARYSFEEFRAMPLVLETLRRVDHLRKKTGKRE